MPFVLLLVLTLTCLQPQWPQPPAGLGPTGSVFATWGGVAILVVGAAVIAHRFCHALQRAPAERSDLLRRFSAWRRYHLYAQLGFFLAALYGLGWGWTGKGLFVNGLWFLPGVEVVLLGPLLLSLVFGWSRFYDVERAAHVLAVTEESRPSFPGRWAYVGLQARHHLLLVLPPLLLLLVQQTVLRIFPGLQDSELFMVFFGTGLLLSAFVCIPLILRLVLRLRPLPPGPVRERLLQTARRLRFRCTDLLLWDTRHSVANAMVTGPLPWLRYVVFTDRLVDELSPEEVDAVFGHEVGHVKHRHMLFYIVFLLTSLLALGAGWNFLEQQLSQTRLAPLFQDATFSMLASLPFVFLAGTYVFLVFGFLSRRCERQADLYGCRTTSVSVFIAALEKVASLNGIPRERPGWLSSWQHSTIAKRVAFLERLPGDPGLEPRFQRRVGLLKWGCALGLAALLFALGPQEIWQVIRGHDAGAARAAAPAR